MERRLRPQQPPLPFEYLALPENTERYEQFLDFYHTHCFPNTAPTYDINGEPRVFPHLLTCGMTPDRQTIVLRSTDGPELDYILLSHDLNDGSIEQYDIEPGNPTFYQDDRRFQFGTSPLILDIHAVNRSTEQPINLELTSQSCLWIVDGRKQQLEDIYMLPSLVNYYRQAR